MKCAEITDAVIAAIESGKYQFIRLNFPNGDMVGHTGIYQAVQVSMGALDICLERLYNAVRNAGGIMLVTADHGNADDMYEHDKSGAVKLDKNGEPRRKTSHSLNPVPCFIYDPDYKGEYSQELNTGLGISSIAGTCAELLGFKAPADYDKPVINWKIDIRIGMSSTPILLVDSFAQIYRCYHAVRHLSTADGVPTNAVFAMTKFLLKLEKEHPSENGAVCV